MKPVISPTGINTTVDKNFTSLRECLDGGISLDNFKGYVVSGTTDASPDTEKSFNHSMSPQPIGWFPLVGDVYLQKIDQKTIDVRATKPNVPFKIFLIQGDSLTSEIATAPSIDTTGYINSLLPTSTGTGGGGSTTSPIDLTPLNFTTQLAQMLPAGHHSVQVDANYFYVTGGNTAFANAKGKLFRVDKLTGATSELTLNATAFVGPMCLSGGTLYVAEMSAAATTVYFVDTATFTSLSTTTIGDLGSMAANWSDLYSDGTNIFMAGVSNNGGTTNTRVWKRVIGGALTTLSLSGATAATTTARGMVSDGTSLWIFDDNGPSLRKVAMSAFTLTASYTIPNSSTIAQGAAIAYDSVNQKIYIPLGPSNGIPTVASGVYATLLVEFDINTTTFTEMPVFTNNIRNVGTGASLTRTAPFINNVLADGTYVYLLSGGGDATNTNFDIIRYNPATQTQETGRLFIQCAKTNLATSMRPNLIFDTDGSVVVIPTTGDDSLFKLGNFVAAKVDFSNFSS